MSRHRHRVPARAERGPAPVRSRGHRAPPRRQRGLVLVLLLALGVAVALWGITSSLGVATQRVDRDRATMAAIMQAKEALIARAALDISRPGSLPCPDQDNDGQADAVGVAGCISQVGSNFRVGRLPWRTLGLPDLRDSSGERLWYAFSANFKDNAGVVINSDTPGQIQLTGIAPAQRVVAVIIAPGAALNQNRDPAVAAQINDVANYLEGENNYKLDPGGVNNEVFQNANPSGTFNDIVVPITEEELFGAVENMLALRLREHVKPLIDTEYRDFWGAYPFPAAFDPGTAAPPGFLGVVGATEGQLPVDPNQLAYAWDGAASDTAFTVESGGTLGTNTCGAAGSDWQCTVDVVFGTPTVRMTAKATNVGRAFAWYNQPQLLTDNATVPMSVVGLTGTLDASGDGTVTFRLTLTSPGPSGPWTIRFRPPEPNPKLTRGTAVAGPNAQFFFDGEWFRLVYYAVSPGALPSGPLACTLSSAGAAKAPAPCPLGVDPLYQPLGGVCPGAPQPLPAACLSRLRRDGTTEDAGVMLVLAGRAMLVGGTVQSRPASALAEYLEDAKNLNSPPLVPRQFEQKPRDPSFNDRVVVLAP